MIELLFLGGIEVLLADLEIGTGIDHVAVQPEAIKLVGDVVVIAHRRAISAHGVPAPPKQATCDMRWPGLAEPLGKGDADPQHVLQAAFHIDLALDIGSPQPPDVAGEEIARRPWRPESERDSRLRRELEDFSVPENQTQLNEGGSLSRRAGALRRRLTHHLLYRGIVV